MKKQILLIGVASMYATAFGAAGDFTASQHQEFLLKAEENWTGGKYEDDLKPHVDVALMQLNGQTARFAELDNPAKDNTVSLTWMKTCGIDDSAFDRATDTCTITGVEIESDAKEYEMTLLRKTGFKVNLETVRTNIYEVEEIIAKGFAKADKELSEYWAKQLLVFLNANKGPNIPAINGVVDPFTWNAGTTETNIPAGSFNIGIVANLIKQQLLNQVNGGWFVNDGSLFEAWTNAGLNSGNLDGKGDDMRLKQIKMGFDMWNFAAAGLTNNMFMVDRNAVAMKTYTRYPSTPQVLGGTINQTRYSMESNILPGVKYDVIHQLSCVSGKDYHTFQVMTQGGIWLNPESCPQTIGENTYTANGIYAYAKTA